MTRFARNASISGEEDRAGALRARALSAIESVLLRRTGMNSAASRAVGVSQI
jgi:hypothetical protein